jgi:hypothetical protein
MSDRYFVTAVRKSKGVYTDEGRYPDETASLVRLAELGDDPDCLIAEVNESLETSPHGLYPEIVIAQSERLDGEWVRIEGELRTRTEGDEAEKILKDGKVSEIITESGKLRQVIEQGLETRGIKAGDTVDCLAIASLYEGSCSLGLPEIQGLVREVGLARRVKVVG